MVNKKQMNLKIASSLIMALLVLSYASALVCAAPPSNKPPPPPPPGYTYIVYGYLKDSQTSNPIFAASVKLYKGSTYLMKEISETNGYFTFTYTSSSRVTSFTVKITHQNYVSTTRTKSASTYTNFGNIYMTPLPQEVTYTVQGDILSSYDNGPLGYAHIDVYKPVYEGWYKVTETTANSNGHYYVEFNDIDTITTMKVEASAADHYTGVTTKTESDTDFSMNPLTLIKKVYYTVSGSIIDSLTQVGINGASVDVYRRLESRYDYIGTAESDYAGNFLFQWEEAYPGGWTGVKIEATKQGFTEIAKDLAIGTGLTYSNLQAEFNTPIERYALIVGISDYKSAAVNDLPYSDDDANDWFEQLYQKQNYIPTNIYVLGDDSSLYVKDDGLATEYNVKQKLLELVEMADGNDMISFITSGHGYTADYVTHGLDMWDTLDGESGEDGLLTDNELAAILLDCRADNVFLCFMNCFSGGFQPELAALGSSVYTNIYFLAAADGNNVGYQSGSYHNSELTYWLLMYLYDYPTHSLEDAFQYVLDDGIMTSVPFEYDGDSQHDMYLS